MPRNCKSIMPHIYKFKMPCDKKIEKNTILPIRCEDGRNSSGYPQLPIDLKDASNSIYDALKPLEL